MNYRKNSDWQLAFIEKKKYLSLAVSTIAQKLK